MKVRDLQIDESGLTGESVAVEKELGQSGDLVLPQETPLAERDNMAYAGSFVTFGQGSGIVIAIANKTETGKISQLLDRHIDLTTPLTRKFNQFSQNWLLFVLGMATLTFAVRLGRPVPAGVSAFKEAVEPAVALIVGAIGEGLPAVITVTLAVGVSRMATRHAIVRKLPAVEILGGATVICIGCCGSSLDTQGNPVEVDREQIHHQVDEMAKQGLRVLALAKKPVPQSQNSVDHSDLESGLIFLGLQGMIDPPRAEAIAAVQAFDTPQPKGVGILASSVLSRIIANPLKGYVHKRTLPARPHLK